VALSQERAAIAIFGCKLMENGLGGATIGTTVVGKRAGVIADTMTCIVVKKYKSTRVRRCDEVDWLMIVKVQVQHLDGTCESGLRQPSRFV
jgi:hypothetical protein